MSRFPLAPHTLLVAAVALLVASCGVGGPPIGVERAERQVSDWLEALKAGDAERAWSAVASETQAANYPDGEQAFAADVRAADWASVGWRVGGESSWRDVVWAVYVEVDDGLAGVPRFLLDRALVQPWIVEHTERGIVVFVDPGPPPHIYSAVAPDQ